MSEIYKIITERSNGKIINVYTKGERGLQIKESDCPNNVAETLRMYWAVHKRRMKNDPKLESLTGIAKSK